MRRTGVSVGLLTDRSSARIGATRIALCACFAAGARAQELLRVADLDADWVDDVAVSTSVPGHELFALSAARGVVVWRHEPPPSYRGSARPGSEPRLARAHDLDGDLRPDVAAAWICAESMTDAEHVLVAVHSALDGRALRSRRFPALRGRAGNCRLASAGDANGDGFDDLLLARWSEHAGQGRVDVLCGRSLATLASCLGDGQGTSQGTALHGIGDVDGDGCADFATGVFDWRTQDGLVQRDRGIVEVRSGLDGHRTRHIHASEVARPGSSEPVVLGREVLALPRSTVECHADIGFLVFDSQERLALLAADPRTGVVEHRAFVEGVDSWDFGQRTIRSFTDFDGDGRADFLFAMRDRPREDGWWRDGLEAGSLRILSADGAVLREWVGDAPFVRLGTACAAAGDVDGDGIEDVWAVQIRALVTPEILLFSGASGACLHRTVVSTW